MSGHAIRRGVTASSRESVSGPNLRRPSTLPSSLDFTLQLTRAHKLSQLAFHDQRRQLSTHNYKNYINMDKCNSMTLDRLTAMRQQEDNRYRQSTEHLDPSLDASADIPLYNEWRSQMLTWAYTISSTCKFQEETVEIAMSLVDRFVAIRTEYLSDSFAYQVACMASLYTAAKMNEEHCLTPKQMETLSSERFSIQDIEAMESEILVELNWLVNPPTAISFIEHLLELTPSEYVPDKKTVMEVAESHVKLAISDSSFLSTPKSVLALASLVSAVHGVVGSTHLDVFVTAFCKALGYNDTQAAFQRKLGDIRQKLRSLVFQSMDLGVTAMKEGTRKAYHYTKQQSRDGGDEHVQSWAHYSNSGISPRGVTETHRSITII